MVDRGTENAQSKKRLTWLDFTRFVAMVAVVVDHYCCDTLSAHPLIQNFSLFSVSLFVLAAGYGVELSYEREGISYKKQFGKLVRLFLSYALANIIVIFCLFSLFDGQDFLNYLFNFNLQGPYYYFAFFFQLVMIAPFLVRLCATCASQRKTKWLWHLLTLLAITAACIGLINHTKILEIYGGGGKLLGGTYLLLYYIGIVAAREKLLDKAFKDRSFLWLVVCGLLWLLWNYYNWKTRYALDIYLSPLFGDGKNPPSVYAMTSALLMLCACYCLDTTIDKGLRDDGREPLKRGVRAAKRGVLFLGRNTLYIFLYHAMAQTLLREAVDAASMTNAWHRRIIIFMGMLVLPAVVGAALSKAIRRIQAGDEGGNDKTPAL